MTWLEQFYQAWMTKNTTVLATLLDDDLFGYRCFDTTVCYTKDDVLTHIAKTSIDGFDLTQLEEDGDTIQYDITITQANTTHHVVGKGIVHNGLMVKLYETIKTDEQRIQLVCAYDGSAFLGYQRQPQGDTIQGTIERAIQTAFGLEQEITVHASGRTDRGVHAHHQVLHFDVMTDIPVGKMTSMLQRHLPNSIQILETVEVPQTWHSRYDVIAKEYQYKINTQSAHPTQRNYEWYVPDLDLVRLQKDASCFVGTHDFQAFTTNTTHSTIRTIYEITIEQQQEHLFITMKGNGFLRYMVRYIVMALVRSNQGLLPMTVSELLESKDVTLLKEMAPPGGLYLNNVFY